MSAIIEMARQQQCEQQQADLPEYRRLLLLASPTPADAATLLEIGARLGKSAERMASDARALRSVEDLRERIGEVRAVEWEKQLEQARHARAEHHEETLQIVRQREREFAELNAAVGALELPLMNSSQWEQQLSSLEAENWQLLGLERQPRIRQGNDGHL